MKEIQRLREEKGLTRSEMASEIGITPEYLRLIELGRRIPSDQVAFDINHFLGMSVTDKRPVRGRGRPRASTSKNLRNERDEYIRIEALKAACTAFPGEKFTANSIIRQAKLFEAYLKGEQ